MSARLAARLPGGLFWRACMRPDDVLRLSASAIATAAALCLLHRLRARNRSRHEPGSEALEIERHILDTQVPAAALGIRVDSIDERSLALCAPLRTCTCSSPGTFSFLLVFSDSSLGRGRALGQCSNNARSISAPIFTAVNNTVYTCHCVRTYMYMYVFRTRGIITP